MISMVVVLPAPLGPSSPKQVPSGTAKETPSTARDAGILFDEVVDFEDRCALGHGSSWPDAPHVPRLRLVLCDGQGFCRHGA